MGQSNTTPLVSHDPTLPGKGVGEDKKAMLTFLGKWWADLVVRKGQNTQSCHPWMDYVWQTVWAAEAQGGRGRLFWNVRW